VSRELPTGELARRWDETYATRGADRVSWCQAESAISLELVEALSLDPAAAIIDIGGGAIAGAGFEPATSWS
jgi:hypothetical protein